MAQSDSDKLDLALVSQYFTKQGFEIVKIDQFWRNITGLLKRGNELFFLKLASTVEISQRAQNEFLFNQTINLLPINEQLPVKIPRVFSSGHYQNLFWFLSEYIEGAPIVTVTQSSGVESLIRYLPIIAKTATAIINLKLEPQFLSEGDEDDMQQRQEKMVSKLNSWASHSQENIDDLLDWVIGNFDKVQIAPAHRDFVPWHFLQGKIDLYLIDNEHFKTKSTKFYDVGYFYHRVYTKLKRPDIAASFLKEFKESYPLTSKDRDSLKWIIGQRLVGGYFDAKFDNITSISLQNELKELLLSDTLL